MFYIGIILLSMGIQRIGIFFDSLLLYSSYGYSYLETHDLWMGLILGALGGIFIVKRWYRKHRHLMFWRICGYILLIAALGTVSNNSLYINDYLIETVLGKIIIIFSYVIPGILLIIYNKKINPQQIPYEEEVPEEEVNEIAIKGSSIDRLIYKLNEALNTNYAKNDSAFTKNLDHSIKILDEIQRDSFKIDENFLEQIAKLTDFYLDIEDNEFQTAQSQATLDKIVETYNTIDEALENIYDRNFTQTGLDIEGDIIAMKTKLNMEGSLDSPFEKFKESQK